MADHELLTKFFELDHELGLMNLLRALNAADGDVRAKCNVILVLSETEELKMLSFANATEALRVLFTMEQNNPGQDIVLVRGDTSEDVREAFMNYFSDARDFIALMETSCEQLAGDRVRHLHAE
jgi:putative GTP pyrophosphokinase